MVQNAKLQVFLSGAFVSLLLISIFLLVLLGWKQATSRDNSQNQMEFMYKMTHELQTPVSSIRLSSDMLSTNAVVQNPERLHKYLNIINEESQRMQWHIENVLHIARAENQDLALKLEKINLNDLIESILNRYNEVVTSNLNADNPVVSVDREHLTNVLHNLIDNALKYTPKDPKITISTTQKKDNVEVSVLDNGIGIAKEEQKKIFGNFYRIHDNASNIKGFGLGLSYVQQIAKAHHWQLELTSHEGEGSNFTIIIPTTLS
jgi:two-component system phosphate regulon sensor histidine kinase PhoR